MSFCLFSFANFTDIWLSRLSSKQVENNIILNWCAEENLVVNNSVVMSRNYRSDVVAPSKPDVLKLAYLL